MMRFRVVVGVPGASGPRCGFRLLETLREHGGDIHALLGRAGEKTSYLDPLVREWKQPAIEDLRRRPSIGSFQTSALVDAPCSVNTLCSIAAGVSSTLVVRASSGSERAPEADSETALHPGHLRRMVTLTEVRSSGVPPSAGFYQKLRRIVIGLVVRSVERVLALLGLPSMGTKR